MAISRYVLTEGLVEARTRRLREPFKCRRCGKPFREGDRIISKPKARTDKSQRKYYHRTCFNSMYFVARRKHSHN